MRNYSLKNLIHLFIHFPLLLYLREKEEEKVADGDGGGDRNNFERLGGLYFIVEDRRKIITRDL